MSEVNKNTYNNNRNSAPKEAKDSVVERQTLINYAVQYGSQTRRWNPKMKQYIYTAKEGTHIINLTKTVNAVNFSYRRLFNLVKDGGRVLFVGTTRIASKTIKENAIRSSSFFVDNRWLGGTLTNFRTVKKSIDKLRDLERLSKDNFDGYTKKEGILLYKEMKKLQRDLGGIKFMRRLPQAVVVIQTQENEIAIKEANKLGIPVFGLVDTDCNPDGINYIIPTNDDSSKSLSAITTILADAVCQAKGEPVLAAFKKAEEVKVLGEVAPLKKRHFQTRVRSGKFAAGTKATSDNEDVKFVKEEIKVAKEAANPVKEEVKVENTIDLSKNTVAQLKEIAKEKGITIKTGLKKADIIELLGGN